MSMDDQYEQMLRFTRALEQFNDNLNTSVRDLEEKHAAVSPLWQDEMRQDYDREWEPLHERMVNYARIEAQRYVEFLHAKARLLERYLRGG